MLIMTSREWEETRSGNDDLTQISQEGITLLKKMVSVPKLSTEITFLCCVLCFCIFTVRGTYKKNTFLFRKLPFFSLFEKSSNLCSGMFIWSHFELREISVKWNENFHMNRPFSSGADWARNFYPGSVVVAVHHLYCWKRRDTFRGNPGMLPRTILKFRVTEMLFAAFWEVIFKSSEGHKMLWKHVNPAH